MAPVRRPDRTIAPRCTITAVVSVAPFAPVPPTEASRFQSEVSAEGSPVLWPVVLM